ncbi:MAG: formylglycine-generating enzyme family protein, partial [Ignavibacteria bacterium]|nr:formylglycine-generating enzyme family protein [Ignavibacteria bacterium]
LDGSAYADWAGLRPFTELEFEKACRGTLTPTVNEYGWGNTSLHSSSYEPISNPGAPNEVPSSSGTNGNSAYTGTVDFQFGPLRAGIFATGSSTRIIAGASYYGVMELTGNLWETVVSLGTQEGRDFEGTHGNGVLTNNGEHNISDWPISLIANGQIDKVPGAGFRGGGIGGDFAWPPERLRISDRMFINVQVNFRALEDGMRLVRTAP